MQGSSLRKLVLVGWTVGLITTALPIQAQDLESRITELEQELMLMKTQLTSQVKQDQEAAAAASEDSGDKYKNEWPDSQMGVRRWPLQDGNKRPDPL